MNMMVADDIDGDPQHRREVKFRREAMTGNLNAVRSMLDTVNINCTDTWGSTPLMLAANKEHLGVVNALVDANSQLDGQDKRGITTLMEASWNNHLPIVQCLVSNGAKLDVVDERHYTALMQAAEEGHVEVVKFLVKKGANLDNQDKKKGYTSLMWAIAEGHSTVVHVLVGAGANLNLQDRWGFTAMMQAARRRYSSAVQFLVGAGADLDIRDKKGRRVYEIGTQELKAIQKGKKDLHVRYLTILSSSRCATYCLKYETKKPDVILHIAQYLVLV